MKKRLAIAVICVTMFAFGAGAPVQAAAGNTRATSQSTANRISSAQAEEIALKETGGGTVEEVELEREKGKLVYEVEIRCDDTKYEVHVDAESGNITRVKSESSFRNKTPASTQKPSSQTTIEPPKDSSTSAQISRDKAKEIALAKVGGGTVKEIDLERKNGKSIYEVEITYKSREYDVKIDADTGEILRCKIDD